MTIIHPHKGIHFFRIPDTFVLWLFSKKELCGYDIIKEFENRSKGNWKPSPALIYPLLLFFTTEGLIEETSKGTRGKKFYKITQKGNKKLNERMEELKKDLLYYEDFLKEVFEVKN
ncbi:MAG: Transcriptional regulator PadR-like family protein [Candidatus Methanofastidiosum methylothiophilum]|uniref:Transcriptional regulator PadR-like family protein n=1 Tax=Candidatus Methanofastidiosum methylothiophilum TaxID=1705564 RepID=A0A150J1C7_9EURY|nr:MAG: Transcriptional regulator PadR-like family protein [Candidatus Methanofastidiosum methylthiophilus]KYC48435.1 MAG: Transcriptional regulator PadR-like family protein [Candidatus Methanofastidiosum methylthiophilus]KYC51053.1 MAG: Transcriptional regulator PadR-like family protein [Candidatus Methanofastidiosum methylthiophilus]